MEKVIVVISSPWESSFLSSHYLLFHRTVVVAAMLPSPGQVRAKYLMMNENVDEDVLLEKYRRAW